MSRLRAAWRFVNLPCCEFSRLASEELDRDLDLLQRIALRSHLLYCLACRRNARQTALLRAALRKFARRLESGHELPGPGLPDDIRERIKRALANP